MKKEYIVLITEDSDRRSKNIELTDLGQKFADENIKTVFQMEERSLQNMSVSEIEAMIRTSRRFLELIREEAALIKTK